MGVYKYSVNGIGTVIFEECMSHNNEDIVHPILHQDHRLYSRWDDKGSLIF